MSDAPETPAAPPFERLRDGIAHELRRHFEGKRVHDIRPRTIQRVIVSYLTKQAVRDGLLFTPELEDDHTAMAELVLEQFFPGRRPDLRALCGCLSSGFLDYILQGTDPKTCSPMYQFLWLERSRRLGIVEDWSWTWTSDRDGEVKVEPAKQNGAVEVIDWQAAECGCRAATVGSRMRQELMATCPEHGEASEFQRLRPLVEATIQLLYWSRDYWPESATTEEGRAVNEQPDGEAG